jgi:N-acyl-D-aspartate/D-glutamate deacylase
VLIDVFGHGGPLAAHRITEAAVNDAFIDAPEVAIGTDGGPWIRHPRSWGSYPRVLRARVRETGALSLESAIHKMSGLPADILGLARRGRLRAGAFADVVIFDPAAITDRATFETPSAPPEGIRWILLNGAVAVENGVRAEHPHGRLLRRGDDD